MKNFVIDLGNTNKKLALFDGEKLVALEQFKSVSPDTFREFIREHPGVNHCILSSVTPYDDAIRRLLTENFQFYELDEQTPLPIINSYETQATLGKDRLAAAVAGASFFPGKNILIINSGTCITYDFINERNEYLGGAISPGLLMRFNALHTFTGKLPFVSFRDVEILIGKNTEDAILAGVLTGAIAEIEGIAERYRQKYPDIHIVLSGGDYKYFDKRLKISIFALPNIVIHGLQQILVFNVNNAK